MEQVLLKEQTKGNVQLLNLQRQVVLQQIQLTMMSDLIEQLDPEHDYIVDVQNGKLIKKKKEKEDGGTDD